MCGITGILAFTEEGRKYLDKIDDAVKSLHHRGPDGSGVFRHGNVALGHTRLAIIDTSDAAAQPFTSSDGRYTIVFNGEIFNYKELRAELEKEGCVFLSQSDTEVLLTLYAKEGEQCLSKLNGFFAFAVYDQTNGSLFIARDRYGEKPLYTYQHNWNATKRTADAIIFSSEMRAIHVFEPNLNFKKRPLYQYFHRNYLSSTLFQNAFNFASSQYANFAENKSDFADCPSWYDLPRKDTNIPYQTAKNKVRELIDDSVKLRLVSDVPIGTFLSGGVDSSIITAIAHRHKSDIESFSISFPEDPYFDESRYAQQVAKHIGIKHHEIPVDQKMLLQSALDILENLDEPFADSSAIAVNVLTRETRNHVTVALSGDGADELFAGYNKHAAELQVREGKLKTKLAILGAPIWNMLPASRNSAFGNKIRQLRRFAAGASVNDLERYRLWCGFSNKEETRRLLNWDGIGFDPWWPKPGGKTTMNDVLRRDICEVLQNDMLVKVDRMSMNHSLEVRSPFLDYRLVDYVVALPSEYKINRHERKRILKDACRDLLPPEIFTRKKQGFEVPLLKWFRGDLRGMIDELLDEKFLKEQNLFNPEEVKNIRKQLHSNDPGDSAARIWGLIVFQSWWNKYLA